LIEITQTGSTKTGSTKKAGGTRRAPGSRYGRALDPDEAAPVINVQVSSPAKGSRVLRVVGDIDMLTAPMLDSMIADQLQSVLDILVLDLHDVNFMSSAGLASLVTARNQADETGTTLRLVATGDPVLRPLTVTGLATIFEIHPDLETALAP
jgi:anti-sigma B factor antagonist